MLRAPKGSGEETFAVPDFKQASFSAPELGNEEHRSYHIEDVNRREQCDRYLERIFCGQGADGERPAATGEVPEFSPYSAWLNVSTTTEHESPFRR